MQPPETQYVTRPDGVSIAYQVVGEGPQDLLYSPGFVSHLDFMWTDPRFVAFIERLSSFSRLILYDKPGTGLSDPITHVPTLEERANDIGHVLDAAGSERAAIFGISEGGPSALYFTARAPGRVPALIICGSFARIVEPDARDDDRPPGLSDEKARVMWDMAEQLRADWGKGRVAEFFAPSADTPIQRRFWARFERAAASPSMLNGIFDALLGVDVRDVARAIEVPALVVHVTDDIVPVEYGRELAELLPNGRLFELPGRDHAIWFADFERVVDEIEEFLTGARHAVAPQRMLATVLFTDIVDSTSRAAELGDAEWRGLLERHNALADQLVTRGGGRVVKLIGDGLLAAFAGPAAAVQCADELLRHARDQLGLELRAGVHTGECEQIGDDLAGIAVHVGARVSSLAQPGDVWVSTAVRELTLGSGLDFADAGTHELKGVPGTWALHRFRGESEAQRIAVDPERALRVGDRAAAAAARHAPRMIRRVAKAIRGREREPAAA